MGCWLVTVLSILTAALPTARAADTATPDPADAALRKVMQPPPPPETGSEPYPVRNWAFFPGIYHQYGRHALGGEVTALYRGVGVAAGFEPEARYLEAEVAVYAVSFGIGPRFNAAGVAPQWTIAIPLTPVIPYFRTIGAKTDHRGEFGLMLKFPFFDLSHVQGVL